MSSPSKEISPGTRKLSTTELEKARQLIEEVRLSLKSLSEGDQELLFAYRRKLAKELMYDERSKPAQRKSLKRRKLIVKDEIACLRQDAGTPASAAGLSAKAKKRTATRAAKLKSSSWYEEATRSISIVKRRPL